MSELNSSVSQERGSSLAINGAPQHDAVELFAHQMRTYIQVLMGYAELLQDDVQYDLDNPSASYLAAMRRAVDQIGRAVENLVAEHFELQHPLPRVDGAQLSESVQVSGKARFSDTQSLPGEGPVTGNENGSRPPVEPGSG